jgi:cytochrome oxidase assembly protein ShyY1
MGAGVLSTTMYSFLRRPLWILSHVLIALLVVALVGLGFWQRARYHEEKDKKERLETLAVAPPVPYDDLLADPTTSPDDVPESVRYHRVEVTGTYDAAREVAILNRSRDGAPGAWVLTPLVQADGTAVPVVRGWIPYDPEGETPPFPRSEPPTGEVTVIGNLQLTQERGSIGSVDPATGTLTGLSRVDLARYQEQLPFDLEPAWVLLDTQEPPQSGELPALVQLQTKDPSQNFSYMMQWWIFALIAACGYPLVLRVVARNKAKGDQTPDDPDDDEIPWAAGLGPDGEPHSGGDPVASGT